VIEWSGFKVSHMKLNLVNVTAITNFSNQLCQMDVVLIVIAIISFSNQLSQVDVALIIIVIVSSSNQVVQSNLS